MLANIARANPDTMDLFLLVALILFLVGLVLSIIQKAVLTALSFGGLAAMSVAFMFLL